MKARIQIIIVATLLSVLINGCISPEQQLEANKQQMQAIDRIPKAIYGSTRAVIAGDPTKMDPYETASERAAARSLAEIDAIQKDLNEQKQMLNEFLNTAVSATGSAVPGGGLAAAAVNSFLNKINSSSEEAKSARKEAADAAEMADAIETKNNEKYTSTQVEIQNLKIELEKKNLELTSRINAESQLLKDSFVKLTDDQKKEFKEEFLRVAEQKGVSREDLAALTQKSPEELIETYGSGGAIGIVSLLALLRTFGKSRSQKEIDELYDNFVELKTAAVKVQPSLPTKPQNEQTIGK